MRTAAYYNGQEHGWTLAGLYLDGTRADRRQVRRYLDRVRDISNPFVEGCRDAIYDRCEQRAAAIEAGTARWTISPRRARWMAWHC